MTATNESTANADTSFEGIELTRAEAQNLSVGPILLGGFGFVAGVTLMFDPDTAFLFRICAVFMGLAAVGVFITGAKLDRLLWKECVLALVMGWVLYAPITLERTTIWIGLACAALIAFLYGRLLVRRRIWPPFVAFFVAFVCVALRQWGIIGDPLFMVACAIMVILGFTAIKLFGDADDYAKHLAGSRADA